MGKLLSVKEAAVLLKISKQRVLQLIKTNVIQAERISWGYVIREESLEGIKWKRSPGREPKLATCGTCGLIMACPNCAPVETVCAICKKPTMPLCDVCREGAE